MMLINRFFTFLLLLKVDVIVPQSTLTMSDNKIKLNIPNELQYQVASF